MNFNTSCMLNRRDTRLLTRRTWIGKVLKALVGISLFHFSLSVDPTCEASTYKPHTIKKHTIGETFANEVMKFMAGFLFFRHAGDAEISLVPLTPKGRYQATLSGKTCGIIGFFTRHREDTHISELRENKDRSRFICTRLIRDTKIGSSHTTKIFEMDYVGRRLTITRLKGSHKSVHVKPIPEGALYDDPVTAFYNFRFGSYGPVRFGKTFTIHTIPGKKLNHITLKLGSKQETEKKLKNLPFKGKVKYLVYLRLDPDVTKSKKGEIEGWLTPNLIPFYGVAKDVIFFGDVEGKLIARKRFFTPPPPL